MKMFIYILFISAILLVNAAYSKVVEPKPRPSVYGGYTQCIVYKYSYKDGQLDSSSKWKSSFIKYTDKGDKISDFDFNKDSSISKMYNSEYDNKGNLISEIWYDEKYRSSVKRTYKYDD
jgi:hypothetical protein